MSLPENSASGAVPETFALLALMHFHAARLGARLDGTGGLLLLEEQDRSLWDRSCSSRRSKPPIPSRRAPSLAAWKCMRASRAKVSGTAPLAEFSGKLIQRWTTQVPESRRRALVDEGVGVGDLGRSARRLLRLALRLQELLLIEPGIEPVLLEELRVRAALDDPPLLHHEDETRAQHGAQPVRDHEAAASGEHGLECVADQRLGARVKRRRRLVEDQEPGVAEHD